MNDECTTDDNVASSESGSRPVTNTAPLERSGGNREHPDRNFGFMVREAGRDGTMVNECARVAMGLWFQGLSGVQGLTFCCCFLFSFDGVLGVWAFCCCWIYPDLAALVIAQSPQQLVFLFLVFVWRSCCWIYPDFEALVIAQSSQQLVFSFFCFRLEDLLQQVTGLADLIFPRSGIIKGPEGFIRRSRARWKGFLIFSPFRRTWSSSHIRSIMFCCQILS